MTQIIDVIKLTKKYDRRIKLTDDDKNTIQKMYILGVPIREIARKYEKKCSRRLIQFVLFPERDKKLKAIRSEEKRHLWYYSKDRNREAQASIREYKRKLLKEHKLNITDLDKIKYRQKLDKRNLIHKSKQNEK